MSGIWSGRVEAEHLGGEAVLLDLGRTYLVSDHPQRLGGSGRGPTPGELIKGALSSSIALALGAAAERGELAPRPVDVSCGMEMGMEPLEGPLPKLIYLTRFNIDIAVTGPVDAAQARQVEDLARASRVARAITGDLQVEETNAFRSHAEGRGPRPHVDLILERTGTLASTDQPLTAASAAEYLGGGRVLVSWGGLSLIVQDAGPATVPEDLLLSSLAVCTTVFAARAVEKSGAEADIRTHCEGRLEPDGAGGRLDRGLEVIGELTAAQREMVHYCANHCVLGETLRRRAELVVNVRSAGEVAVRASGLTSPVDPGCDDGACCVPEFAASSER